MTLPPDNKAIMNEDVIGSENMALVDGSAIQNAGANKGPEKFKITINDDITV